MTSIRRGRWLAPALCGAICLASASCMAATGAWVAALPMLAVGAVGALGFYWFGGTDTDLGAMVGSRVDERQVDVRLRARAAGGVVTLGAALLGAATSSALGNVIWPFVLVALAGAAAVCVGLVIYSVLPGGTLGDLRAAIGSRADERQRLIRLRSAQLGGIVMVVVCGACSAALRGLGIAWRFEVLIAVFVLSVLVGVIGQRPGRGYRLTRRQV